MMGHVINAQNLNYENFNADYNNNHNFNLKNEEPFDADDSNKHFSQFFKNQLSPALHYPQISENSVNFGNKQKDYINENHEKEMKKEEKTGKNANDARKESKFNNNSFFKQTYMEKIKKLMETKPVKAAQ